MTITIRRYLDADAHAWDAYVASSAFSNCYHLTGWKNVIGKTFGHESYYLLAEDENNKIKGILPIFHLKSSLFGSFMVSLPYFNYGGICADDNGISLQILGYAENMAAKNNAEHLELRHTKSLDSGLSEKKAKVSMRLSLPDSSEELWKALPAKLRSQIRKPTKEGVATRVGGEDELDSFYDVFSVNMRDLGTPVYPKEFFRNILREFPASTGICTAYTSDGKPVASGFLVGFNGMLEIPWASSIRAYNKLSPNMLMYWDSLKFACENNYQVFDFGRSTPGEGTYRFKEQWGAKPTQLYWHYWLKDGFSMPELNPKNKKYQLAISAWRRMPVWLTKIIGPSIVKNLP